MALTEHAAFEALQMQASGIAQPARTGPPDGLGQGYLSITDERLGLLVQPAGAEVENARSILATFSFIEDRSSFASTLAWSAKAKFGFSGGSASARASMSQSYRSSMRRVDIVLLKFIATRKWFLRNPAVTEDAMRLFNEDRKAFIRRYGDRFIRSMTMGGTMSLIYHLDFKTMEDAQKFSASAEGSYGGSSGGASVHSSLLRTASATSVSIEAVVTGAASAPPIFLPVSGGDKKSRKIPATDQLAREIVEYFDAFEEQVTPESEVSVAIETADVVTIPGGPSEMTDFSRVKEVVQEGIELDDYIDDRIAEAEYMRDIAHQWNPQVELPAVSARIEGLLKLSDDLGKALKELVRLPDQEPRLPFSRVNVPRTPDNWTLRKLQEVAAVQKTTRTRVTTDLRVPPSFEGQPAQVNLKIRYIGHVIAPSRDADVTLDWVLADGSIRRLGRRMDFNEMGEVRELKTWLVPTPRDVRAVRMYMAVANGWIACHVSLSM